MARKCIKNCPPWLEKILKFVSLKWLRMHCLTMVGENFEICISEMARNALKLSTMVGENFEIYISEMAKNGLSNHGWRKFRNLLVSNG